MSKRKVVLELTSGSVNRNLDTPESDLDIKQFVLPTFDDLYEGKVFTDFTVTPTKDIEVQDVRRLESLFYKANMTYIELLFARYINTFNYPEMADIIKIRDHIARMNLPNFFKATMGMFERQMKDIQNATSHLTKEVIQKHGYIPKKAMMGVHLARIIRKYHATGFESFKDAIWYEGSERDEMLGYKSGTYSFTEMMDILEHEKSESMKLESVYMRHDFDKDTNNLLRSLLRDLVYNEVMK